MSNQYNLINFLRNGEDFRAFWNNYLDKNDKRIKYIIGINSDPRTLHCFNIIHENISSNTVDYKIIECDDSVDTSEHLRNILQQNKSRLKEVIPDDKWNHTSIDMPTNLEKDLSVQAAKSITTSDLDQYTDIILDITAMSNGVYFPIARNILDWIKKDEIKSSINQKINFHLVVSENSEFDQQIRPIPTTDNAIYMHKFSKRLQQESISTLRKVWIPLLGENQKSQLNQINDEIHPEEICPVFPMPSSDPYRSKKLLVAYRELLCDTLEIEPRNYVYSTENNPFETCKKIYEIARSYYASFEPLRGCNVVISPLSSKLLCVGALLAAYELYSEKRNVGIVYVANKLSDIKDMNTDTILKKSIPYSMWLAGDCYNE